MLCVAACSKKHISPERAVSSEQQQEQALETNSTEEQTDAGKTSEGALPATEKADNLSGLAGIIDDKMIGFPMADGSTYSSDRLVAGHRSLALGTQLKVTNVANNNSVLVTITDRGPFAKDHIIVLSKEAATQLALIGPGLVSFDIVQDGKALFAEPVQAAPAQDPQQTESAPAAQNSSDVQSPALEAQKAPEAMQVYYVQVGAFLSEKNAQEAQNALSQRGFEQTRIVKGDTSNVLNRVQIGPYDSRATAEGVLGSIKTEYPSCFIVTQD